MLESLYGLAKVLVEFKENNVPLSHLLLHKDFIFVDRMTMEMKFICVPLEEERPANAMEEVAHFMRTLLSSVTYDINEDGSYVTKLITLVNTPEQFNISILVNALQDLMSEYGVPYDDIDVSNTYVDYEDDISTIDTSILNDMPESVSVADMEAEALRDEETWREAEAYEDESEENAVEAEEEYVEEETDETEEEHVEEGTDEAEEEYVEEEADEAEEEHVEEEADETEEEYVEEETVEAEEEYVEETDETEEEYIEKAPMEKIEPEPEPIHSKKDSKAVWDEETKKRQQEALRRIAEAENIKSFGNKSLDADIDKVDVDEEVDAMVAEIEAEAEAETEYGNTEALSPKKKPHKLELAKETIVRPVFDSVFEPIIESIDGPIEGDEVPKPYVATTPKPAKNPAKSAKVARAKAKTATKVKVDLEEDENESILSQEVTATEPSLISQLDNRSDTLPKVNPYLIRINNEERIMITKANFKIGKASFGMDYQVTDNGAISRNHCMIFVKDGVYYIRDNKSTNHTYVNGQMVKNGQDVLLTHESTIRIADEDFLFKLR